MAQVFPDTVKLYYEESRAARVQIEELLEKYTLIAAIAVLIFTASFSVILGSEELASPKHVIIDRSVS